MKLEILLHLNLLRNNMTTFQLILFDDSFRESLKPLSSTRPVCDFRIGILTVREKWEKHLRSDSTTATVSHLEQWKTPFLPDTQKQHLWINGRVLPNAELAFEVLSLAEGDALIKGETIIAFHAGSSVERFETESKDHLSGDFGIKMSKVYSEVINRISDVFTNNGAQILADIDLLKLVSAEKLSASNTVIGDLPVILEKGAKAEAVVFNTTKGPIHIGENAEIMEGAMLRGPLSIGANAQVKMGAKIYGDSTIGPGCKVGGEISNTVLFGNSNKAHDGFLGNSVIGEWCNLGAHTSTSNLKNNYGEVSVYNYAIEGSENTGMLFHGLIMGDHAKCGINTMFNTGTVVGVCANVFGAGFPPKLIPDFAWGGAESMHEFQFEKAIEMISNVYKRRSKIIDTAEVDSLKQIFSETKKMRP